jgi:quinol monooxygenase YgiN
MTRKHVRIEYRLKPEVDLDELHRELRTFVAAMHADSADHTYTSYQDVADPRHFVHVGDFDPDRIKPMQEQPFFQRWRAYLAPRCTSGPEATMLAPVVSTRA